MTVNQPSRPLKVCCTCRHWTYKLKGLCTRLNQGVGRFWICEDWQAAEERPRPAGSGPETPSPPPS
jgi:hypothetical protein